jgi:DNA repair exonuclease SbcCD ATPase subunit
MAAQAKGFKDVSTEQGIAEEIAKTLDAIDELRNRKPVWSWLLSESELQKAIDAMEADFLRLVKLNRDLKDFGKGKGAPKPAPAATAKPGPPEGLDGGPSKGFAEYRAKEARADKETADKKVSLARQLTRVEGEIMQAFYAEKRALQAKDAEAAAKAQEEQEYQFKRLRGAGASKELEDYYAKMVGGKDGTNEIKTKWVMEMTLDGPSWSDTQAQIMDSLQGMTGSIALEVHPTLVTDGAEPPMPTSDGNAIGREADMAGAHP